MFNEIKFYGQTPRNQLIITITNDMFIAFFLKIILFYK